MESTIDLDAVILDLMKQKESMLDNISAIADDEEMIMNSNNLLYDALPTDEGDKELSINSVNKLLYAEPFCKKSKHNDFTIDDDNSI